MTHRNCSIHGTVLTGSDGVCPMCLASSKAISDMQSILPNAMKGLIDGSTPKEPPPAAGASQPLLGEGQWVQKTAPMWHVACTPFGLLVLYVIAYGVGGALASWGCAWYSYLLAYLWAVPVSLVMLVGTAVWWYRVYKSGMVPTLAEEYTLMCCRIDVTYWEREDSGFYGYLKTLARDDSRPGDGWEPARYIVGHLVWIVFSGIILAVPPMSCAA